VQVGEADEVGKCAVPLLRTFYRDHPLNIDTAQPRGYLLVASPYGLAGRPGLAYLAAPLKKRLVPLLAVRTTRFRQAFE
jgi:hypothetical protein